MALAAAVPGGDAVPPGATTAPNAFTELKWHKISFRDAEKKAVPAPGDGRLDRIELPPDEDDRAPVEEVTLKFRPLKLVARRPTAEAFQLKRRSLLTEDDLREQLRKIRAVGLRAEDVSGLGAAYLAAYEVSGGYFEPSILPRARPDLASLPFRSGSACQIADRAAVTLATLSRKLHSYVDLATPKDALGQRIDPGLLRQILQNERHGKRPEWQRAEAIPTLRQILMHEDESLRYLLVELLSAIDGKRASTVLAERAVFDLSPTVREAAIRALVPRPRGDYRLVFLKGLRYPWAPAADHAAEALVALRDLDAVPYLLNHLSRPAPTAPIPASNGRFVARELVCVNHLSNCLLCHPPAVLSTDPVTGTVPGIDLIVPTPPTVLGRQSPGGVAIPSGGRGYGGGGTSILSGSQTQTSVGSSGGSSSIPLLIRADVTYLRQDFSVQQELSTVPSTELRFDYLVRVRDLSTSQINKLRTQPRRETTWPQREAVLFALRELTGKDLGTTYEEWKEILPKEEK
jgi:hypothetical protein